MGYRTVEVPESRVVILEGIYALNARLRPMVSRHSTGLGGLLAPLRLLHPCALLTLPHLLVPCWSPARPHPALPTAPAPACM